MKVIQEPVPDFLVKEILYWRAQVKADRSLMWTPEFKVFLRQARHLFDHPEWRDHLEKLKQAPVPALGESGRGPEQAG